MHLSIISIASELILASFAVPVLVLARYAVASRPDSYVGNELLCSNGTHILLVPYGRGWRALRKAVQAILNVTAVDRLLPVQEAEASQTLFELMTTLRKGFTHIRRYSTAVILISVFGQRGASYKAPKVQAL
ncbi:hypothetical protein AYL99_04059 [Fonsecaea erecta]|uniref:Uncharacterized protein n=1 Tax=Fonsecaea erecta TaxID=1367422 RepID=A0A178ZR58_9EURO|nr:hypothetical protein AYL99_04059 [Fonsecaea erecta]OAP61856.1 hypothetical protein AYL99_04059 [Fonsecaea erecta]